jgi:hypothetical protein
MPVQHILAFVFEEETENGEHDGTLSLGTTSKASITINYGHYEQLTVHFLFDPFLFKQVAPMSPVKATILFCG